MFVKILWWVNITRDRQSCHKLHVTGIKLMRFWQSHEHMIPHAIQQWYNMCKLPLFFGKTKQSTKSVPCNVLNEPVPQANSNSNSSFNFIEQV